MSIAKELCIKRQEIFQGKILHVTVDTVHMEGVTQPAVREAVWHGGATCVLPVTADGKLIMVRQFRYAAGKALLEFPAGKLDHPGELPAECAFRELAEEGGVKAGELIDLGYIYTSPGFCNEILYLFLGRKLTPTSQHLDADEFLNIEQYTPPEVAQLIATGEIVDAKTIAIFAKAGSYLQGV